jgi:hypothetical protein
VWPHKAASTITVHFAVFPCLPKAGGQAFVACTPHAFRRVKQSRDQEFGKMPPHFEGLQVTGPAKLLCNHFK